MSIHRRKHRKTSYSMVILVAVSTILFSLIGFIGQNGAYREYTLDPIQEPYLKLFFSGLQNGRYPWSVPPVGRKRPNKKNESRLSTVAKIRQGETQPPIQEIFTEEGQLPAGVCSPVMDAVDYGATNPKYLTPEGQVYTYDTSGMFAPNGIYYYLTPVSEDYFNDAIFIGDSRTEGLWLYGGMQSFTSFIAKSKLDVYTIMDTPVPFHGVDGTEQEMTVRQLLSERTYAKVYLSLGINELGDETQYVYYAYRDIVETIRQMQPNAIIFLQGIMHVTASRSKTDSIFTNANIVDKNEAIASLANGRDIFYIDMNPVVCDENGDLMEEHSADDVHLRARAYPLWRDFLMSNGIIR